MDHRLSWSGYSWGVIVGLLRVYRDFPGMGHTCFLPQNRHWRCHSSYMSKTMDDDGWHKRKVLRGRLLSVARWRDSGLFPSLIPSAKPLVLCRNQLLESDPLRVTE